MKTFINTYGKILIPILGVSALVLGVGSYFLGGNTGETTLEVTTQPNIQTVQNTDPTTLNNDTSVQLKDGTVLKVGDEAEAIWPEWEGRTIVKGKIVNMYPERGRGLRMFRGGVIEINYRYVVDIKAEEESGDDIGADPQEVQQHVRTPFTDTVRAVVGLERDGKEVLFLIRDLDNPAKTFGNAYKMEGSPTYNNLRTYDFYAFTPIEDIENNPDFPDYVVAFAKEERAKGVGKDYTVQ